jgi:hypothetical protein
MKDQEKDKIVSSEERFCASVYVELNIGVLNKDMQIKLV